MKCKFLLLFVLVSCLLIVQNVICQETNVTEKKSSNLKNIIYQNWNGLSESQTSDSLFSKDYIGGWGVRIEIKNLLTQKYKLELDFNNIKMIDETGKEFSNIQITKAHGGLTYMARDILLPYSKLKHSHLWNVDPPGIVEAYRDSNGNGIDFIFFSYINRLVIYNSNIKDATITEQFDKKGKILTIELEGNKSTLLLIIFDAPNNIKPKKLILSDFKTFDLE